MDRARSYLCTRSSSGTTLLITNHYHVLLWILYCHLYLHIYIPLLWIPFLHRSLSLTSPFTLPYCISPTLSFTLFPLPSLSLPYHTSLPLSISPLDLPPSILPSILILAIHPPCPPPSTLPPSFTAILSFFPHFGSLNVSGVVFSTSSLTCCNNKTHSNIAIPSSHTHIYTFIVALNPNWKASFCLPGKAMLNADMADWAEGVWGSFIPAIQQPTMLLKYGSKELVMEVTTAFRALWAASRTLLSLS